MAFKNINEWIDRTYGSSEVIENAIKKADAPMLTTTSGMFNAIYGRMAFAQFNEEATAWNLLPKKGWDKSGWRIRTARGITIGSGGVADAGSIADTVKSTVVEVSTTPKIHHLPFEIGAMTDLLDGDDRYRFEDEMQAAAKDHLVDMDAALLKDLDTLASNNMESIDRVCSSNSEATDGTIGLDTGDADIYGLDRDSVTTYDAYVDHNSGSDRDITIALLRTAVKTIQSNSGLRPTAILTGYDQEENIVNLFESQTRYMTTTNVTLGLNGVKTEQGQGVGLTINAFDNIPIFTDPNVAQDTGSRVYFLNTDHLFVGVAQPTKVDVSEDKLALDKFVKKGLYYTIGELICTNFSAQGKIRDLN